MPLSPIDLLFYAMTIATVLGLGVLLIRLD